MYISFRGSSSAPGRVDVPLAGPFNDIMSRSVLGPKLAGWLFLLLLLLERPMFFVSGINVDRHEDNG